VLLWLIGFVFVDQLNMPVTDDRSQIDLGFTQLDNQISWRFPIALQAFFCALSLVGFLFLPDTPRWYYAQGRTEEGDQVLSRLFALPLESDQVKQQRQEILDTIELESEEGRIQFTDWFWDRSELQSARRIRTSFLILSFQQNMGKPNLVNRKGLWADSDTGINVLVYYSTIVLANVGLSPFMQQLIAAVMNTIFAMGTWITPFTIERWGRRRIMFWTAVGCTLSMSVFIAMNGLERKTLATQWTAIAFVIIFIFLIGFGWMGCPWLYGPEIAPLRYRHLGGSVGAIGEWSMTFVTVFGGGIALQRVGYEIWFWQLASCIGACIFVWFWCPETAGRSLEEIDTVFIEEAKQWPGVYLRKTTMHNLESVGTNSKDIQIKSSETTRMEKV